MEAWKRPLLVGLCWLGLSWLSGCASFNPRIFHYIGATSQEPESPAHIQVAERTLGSSPPRATLELPPQEFPELPLLLPIPPSVNDPASNPRPNFKEQPSAALAKPQPVLYSPPVQNTVEALLIDFPSALQLVSDNNLDIAAARERIRETYAAELEAKAQWLPSLQVGLSYNKHEGTLQASPGNVIDVSRSSFEVGAGQFAVGAGTPMVPGLALKLRLSDGLFNPKIARVKTSAQSSVSQIVTKKTYLMAALKYLDLLEAVQEKAIAVDVLHKSQELAELTQSFAESGEGAQADADRAKTELVVRENAVLRAEEHIETAMARLAELLRMPPIVPIFPKEQTLVPIQFVEGRSDTRNLVALALANRPEVANSKQLVQMAMLKLKKEKTAPWLPSLLLGVSYGGFGGGPGTTIDPFRDRFDLDAGMYWEIRNLGFGEHAVRAQASSRVEQARLREMRLLDEIARQVAEARTQVRSRIRQIAVAQGGLVAAKQAWQRDLDRIREGEGLPIEALQSLRAVDQSQREYVRAVVDHNEAQFRLQWALGWPSGSVPSGEVLPTDTSQCPVPRH
ncbi:MAG: TolC family protein [Gemmataceae bacterium]